MSDLRLTHERLCAFVDDLEALCVKHSVLIWNDELTAEPAAIRVEPVSSAAFAGVGLEFYARDAGEVRGSQC